jgi:hypothetical protein
MIGELTTHNCGLMIRSVERRHREGVAMENSVYENLSKPFKLVCTITAMAVRSQHGTLRFEDPATPKTIPKQDPPSLHFLNPKATLVNPYKEWCSFMQVRDVNFFFANVLCIF